jgi:hypothetical protein
VVPEALLPLLAELLLVVALLRRRRRRRRKRVRFCFPPKFPTSPLKLQFANI